MATTIEAGRLRAMHFTSWSPGPMETLVVLCASCGVLSVVDEPEVTRERRQELARAECRLHVRDMRST